jgi:AcrR family transcriptional regulator
MRRPRHPRSEQVRDYDGKTADERVADHRARLIGAGLELFGEHRYVGTSIRSVLRQSGLRDRYLGESFADLDSLLGAVYAQLINEEVDSCRAAIEATRGGSEGARAMIETLSRSLEGAPQAEPASSYGK